MSLTSALHRCFSGLVQVFLRRRPAADLHANSSGGLRFEASDKFSTEKLARSEKRTDRNATKSVAFDRSRENLPLIGML